MKRARLARHTPLTRGKRLNPKRAKPRRVSVPRDRAYLDRIKQLAYCSIARTVINAGPCWGPIDPMHVGPRNGMSSKGSDYLVAPGCRKHHDDLDQRRGCFEGWSQERRLRWGAEVAAEAMIRAGRAGCLEVPW